MHIFLSWSGTLSKGIAAEFKDLIEQILPGNDVYLSNQEIKSGERWIADIGRSLEDSSYGLLFVNPDNKDAPWILFEAGALSKSFESSNVVPVLHNVTDADLAGSPLAQFQNRKLNKEDIKTLILDINSASDRSIPVERAIRSFEAFWPQTDENIQKSISKLSTPQTSKKPDTAAQIAQLQDSVAEVLKLLRAVPAPRTDDLTISARAVSRRIYLEKFGGRFYILPLGGSGRAYVKDLKTKSVLGTLGRELSGADRVEAAEAIVESYLRDLSEDE